MTYLIIKTVHRNKYYWSDAKLCWQGLINNGTYVRKVRLDFLMEGFLKKSLAQDFEIIKNNKTYDYDNTAFRRA